MKVASFIREVKSESKKVSWPKKQEAINAAFMVFVMSLICALFFLLVDTVVYKIVQWFLGV